MFPSWGSTANQLVYLGWRLALQSQQLRSCLTKLCMCLLNVTFKGHTHLDPLTSPSPPKLGSALPPEMPWVDWQHGAQRVGTCTAGWCSVTLWGSFSFSHRVDVVGGHRVKTFWDYLWKPFLEFASVYLDFVSIFYYGFSVVLLILSLDV